MRNRKQTFGEQAARFSLYAPLTVLLLGFLTSHNRDNWPVAVSIFTINMLLIVGGFALGIVALFSMRRYGRHGILVRSILGVLVNGMVIVAMLGLFLPLMGTNRMKGKLAGQWTTQSGPAQGAAAITLTLNDNGEFTFASASEKLPPVRLDGKWTLNRASVMILSVGKVTEGDAAVVGKVFPLGVVTSVDGERMVLKTDAGEEVYSRTARQD